MLNDPRTFEHLSDVSSSEYFSQLLKLTQVEWLRPSLLQGFVTCAGAGTETTICSARDALLKCISLDQGASDEISLLVNSLLQILQDHVKEDRYDIPTLEVLALLFNGGVFSSENGAEAM